MLWMCATIKNERDMICIKAIQAVRELNACREKN